MSSDLCSLPDAVCSRIDNNFCVMFFVSCRCSLRSALHPPSHHMSKARPSETRGSQARFLSRISVAHVDFSPPFALFLRQRREKRLQHSFQYHNQGVDERVEPRHAEAHVRPRRGRAASSLIRSRLLGNAQETLSDSRHLLDDVRLHLLPELMRVGDVPGDTAWLSLRCAQTLDPIVLSFANLWSPMHAYIAKRRRQKYVPGSAHRATQINIISHSPSTPCTY